jgi:hypothetical protein
MVLHQLVLVLEEGMHQSFSEEEVLDLWLDLAGIQL